MTEYPFKRAVGRPALVDQLILGDTDITTVNGIRTPRPAFKLIQPFGYGDCTLVIPGVRVHAGGTVPGYDELLDLEGLPFIIRSRDLTTGQVVRVRYRGRVIKVNGKGASLQLDLGGVLAGPAALRNKQIPIVRQVKDTGRWMFDAVENAGNFPGVHFAPRLGPTTGIELTETGGMTHLSWMQHLCTMSVTDDGDQYTCMPTEPGGNVFEFALKDATTIHYTAYVDASRIVLDVGHDAAEHWNTGFAEGVTDEGMIWDGSVFPRGEDGEPAPFPGHLELGDSGDAVLTLNWQLINARLSTRADGPLSEYDDDTVQAVERFQEGAGLDVTGEVGEATWNKLFDIDAVGWGLDGARIMPQVQDPRVRPFNYTSNGKLAERNPLYEETKLRVDRNFKMGAGVTEREGIRWMRAQRKRMAGKSWAGTITFNGFGLIVGEHNPGDPDPPPEDIVSAEDLWPGQNIWVPNWDGGTLFHIADADIGTDAVTATIDTHYRDSLELSEINDRIEQSRSDPRRDFMIEERGSKKTFDAITPFNEKAGINTRLVPCLGFQWEVFEVFVGGAGTISEFLIETDIPAETCGIITAMPITPAELERHIGNPRPVDEDGESWLTDIEKDAWYRSKIGRYAWGTEEQPGGYSPKKKTNRRGERTSHALTGVWRDPASFGYVTFRLPVLYVAAYADRDTVIQRGRMFKAQLEPF